MKPILALLAKRIFYHKLNSLLRSWYSKAIMIIAAAPAVVMILSNSLVKNWDLKLGSLAMVSTLAASLSIMRYLISSYCAGHEFESGEYKAHSRD